MAESKGIRAGRAFVEIFADSSAMVRGLRTAQARLSAFGGMVRGIGMKMAAIGGLITGPLIAGAKAAADSGAALFNMSKRTGMTVEALSALSFAADMTGTDLEGVEAGVKRMQRSIFAAGQGTKPSVEALRELGLSFKDLKDLSPDDQFALIAQRISALQDPTAKAALAMQIFGRSGTALLPMMKSLHVYKDAAKDLGFVKSTESVNAAKDFFLVSDLLGRALKSLRDALGTAVMPLLKDFAAKALDIVLRVRDWVKANPEAIRQVFMIAKTVALAGAALIGLGYGIQYAGKAFGLLATCLSVAGSLLSGILGIAAAMFTPLGMVAIGAMAIGAALLFASGQGGDALKWLSDCLGGIVADSTAAFGAIGKALANGNIGLAAKILWLTLQLEWAKGSKFLRETWTDLKAVWILLCSAVGQAWISAVAGIKTAMAGVGAFFAGIMNDAEAGMKKLGLWLAKLSGDNIDEKGALAIINRDYNVEQGKITADKDKSIKAAQAQEASDLAKNAAEAQKALAANQAEYEGLGKDLADARKMFDAAVAEGNALPGFNPGDLPAGGKFDLEKFLKDAKDAAAAGGADLMGKQAQMSVSGTFASTATWGMAGGKTLDRIAKAAERNADAAEGMEEELGIMSDNYMPPEVGD